MAEMKAMHHSSKHTIMYFVITGFPRFIMKQSELKVPLTGDPRKQNILLSEAQLSLNKKSFKKR